MAEQAVIAQKRPYMVEVEEGQSYYWCQCGRSGKQPFCDGSHKETGFSPVPYKAESSGTVFFCGCKHTNGQPLCDGTHGKL